MGFFIYIVVGLIAWLVDAAIFQFLWPLIGIAASQALARIAGAVTAFTLNRKHTFGLDPESGGIGFQGLKYGILLVLNWAITVALIFVLYHRFGIEPLWAKIITDVFIIPGNYWVMKLWIFPGNRDKHQLIKERKL